MNKKESTSVLLLQPVLTWMGKWIREDRIPLLCAILFGFLAHGFACTNKLVNHDDVSALFIKGGTVTSGRWGLGALDSIFPNYSMPWIYGLLTIIIMSAAICIILHIFAIRSKFLQGLLAGLIITFPSLTGLFGYMFTTSSYAVSFLLAVLAVWLITRKNLWYAIPALMCMVLSLSIYQSYISIAVSMLVLVLIQQLLHGESFLTVLRRGIYYVGFLVIALAGYYVATQLVFLITGTSFGVYAEGTITLSFSSILSGSALAYESFFRFLTESFHGLLPTSLSRLLHGAALACSAVLLLLRLLDQKKREPLATLLLLVLILLLPLAINCMYLITAADSIHTLVLYSFITVYLLMAVLADDFLGEGICTTISTFALNLLTLALAVIIIINTYIANEAYLNLHLRYENAYAFCTTLLADLRQQPEFTEDTKLALIGDYQDPAYFEEKFWHTDLITGVHGFLPDSYSMDRFLEYYMGFPLPMATPEEIEQIQQSPAYEAMNRYPYYGSMQMIDGFFVVKFS